MNKKPISTKQSISLLSSVISKMHKFTEKKEKSDEIDQLTDIENIIQNS